MQNKYHLKKVKEVINDLQSRESGLMEDEAKARLANYGPNKLPEGKANSLLAIYFHQFQSSLIYVLLAASLAVVAMGDFIDGMVILFVIFFNSIVGTLQEGKAQNTLLALKKYMQTSATVLRDGKKMVVPDEEVVLGDIVFIQEGERIPADGRIISANALKIDESALTGESDYKHKTECTFKNSDVPVAERKNMVFKGTSVVTGNGKIIVTATGTETLIGRIAKEIVGLDTEIPLKKDIRKLSRIIIGVVFLISTVLFVLGLLSGYSFKNIFETAVAVAVSVIPEGLPIVLTLVLATGVWRMSKRNVLVKKLQAVEALGQTKVIAIDKTGTLTRNELMVRKIYVNDKTFLVESSGYEPRGEISFEGRPVDSLNHPELVLVGKISALCSNAQVFFEERTKAWKISGDPTEAAMLTLSYKIGFREDLIESEMPRISEIPFNYKTKFHATLCSNKSHNFLAVAGAPENILRISSKIWSDGELGDLTEEKRKYLGSVFVSMSREGMRIIALAVANTKMGTLESGDLPALTFVGFLGMKDALRNESKEAVAQIQEAGIKVVMITGDHEITAEAIAREAGIFQPENKILTGVQVEKMSEKELSKHLTNVRVFARVTPEHKLKIIKAYQQKGEIIAMTGDGVNDALSLSAADLGVAMGKIGTEVAKEASDIILLDDNVGNITFGVEEGRNIYKTIKKVILYLFSTSVGEVLTIFAAFLVGLPLPILAVQILWLNLVTDGFLDVALAMEPKEDGIFRKKFSFSAKQLIDKLMVQRIFYMAIPMMLGTLFLFGRYYRADIYKAWTISLTTLAVFQWFNAWNCRSENRSVFQMNPFSNKFLAGATVIVVALQSFALYNPFMQKILHTVPLSANEWLMIVPIAFSIIIVEEVRKFVDRRKSEK